MISIYFTNWGKNHLEVMMNYVDGRPPEYNLVGFLYLAAIIGIFVYFSVIRIKRSREIYKAREDRNEKRKEDE